MKNRKMSLLIKNTSAVAGIVTASTIATGLIAPSASAISMVPQFETEVKVDATLGCLDPAKCLTDLTPYWIQSIESQVDSTSGTKSRLFVDEMGTANVYGSVKFNAVDAGTNPGGFWFRPSETKADGSAGEETGQLEVGTYKFTFTKIIPELKVSYFDAELGRSTGFLDTDGTLIDGVNLLPGGPDSNLKYQTLKDVSFITLKLGYDYPSGTGDGVRFQLDKPDEKSIPEPSAVVGLSALGLMGIFGMRKRNRNGV
ncbi:MAG TPA: PEP-CTERM sorting domain-containing protein [Cyanobacteria bacterium UBA11149]|nr:PEP-CTERM sorting domain-containing protein [Cyanobacteria bacterium UBA11367]HBE56735.1 PEP-CTERM sorting domain-containing protein [Cyanobacteria bacterium UBA11366]HBK65234.1 PEP-CTERM sorting domain-containing protein [Cyanobacteria bacterium UBA11166]HBR74623.1 PEP-CTERM sorting domain-containing protein [Cyanobacteria bacterium UBA11159]HBS72357.1 PEP-CTERM sorting domain-containing protein [Cyanobacteria bacterium UBA11153]HBW88921.1 PEP-CTERM sorting domain-containing protein [Cyano